MTFLCGSLGIGCYLENVLQSETEILWQECLHTMAQGYHLYHPFPSDSLGGGPVVNFKDIYQGQSCDNTEVLSHGFE